MYVPGDGTGGGRGGRRAGPILIASKDKWEISQVSWAKIAMGLMVGE
jgi:hypothetical protein